MLVCLMEMFVVGKLEINESRFSSRQCKSWDQSKCDLPWVGRHTSELISLAYSMFLLVSLQLLFSSCKD